jgi:SARP family transcriptional regulator, regulator of embCAB operon
VKTANSPEKIFIRTFGGLTVYRHHSPVVISWESQKARLLFCYLLITSDQWVHREKLLELLWPGCDHESGSKNFKTTLSRLRKSFQGARSLNPVLTQGDAYRLNFEAITCDNGIFREHAVAGIKHMTRGDVKGAREHLEKAQELYAAEFLPEEPSDMFIGESRRELSGLFTTVLNYLERIYTAEERTALLAALKSLSHFPSFQRT